MTSNSKSNLFEYSDLTSSEKSFILALRFSLDRSIKYSSADLFKGVSKSGNT